MQHDFVGALQDLVNSQVPQNSLNRVILQVAVASVHLKSLVYDVEAFVSCEFLGHCAVHSVVRFLIGDAVGSMAHHQSTCLQVGGHSSKLKLDILVGTEGLAELLSLFYVFLCYFQRFSRSSERARCDVQTPPVKAAHPNFESLTFFPDQVFFGHNHIVETQSSRRLAVPPHFVLVGSETKAFHAIFQHEGRNFVCSCFAND